MSLNIIVKHVILVIFQKDYLSCIWKQNIQQLFLTKIIFNIFGLFLNVKDVITQHNHLLYAVPYQHFTNSIENYFSMLKSRLQKLDGLTHAELKDNIINTITNIPKDKYRNIIKGAYERPEKYISNKNKTRKIKKNYL